MYLNNLKKYQINKIIRCQRSIIKEQQKPRLLLAKCLKKLIKLPRFNTDGRHIARANETNRIKKLTDVMNNNTNIGKKLIEEYEKKFKKKIKNIELAGSNTKHFDLVVHHTDETRFNIEEKHSKKKLNTTDVPWKLSVQVLNGVGSHFIVSEIYAKSWYDRIIVSTDWNKILHTTTIPSVPSFDDWVKDAFRCGDPKTEFVKAIKKRCRELFGENSSFTGLGGTPDLRNALGNFVLTDLQKQIFIGQIQKKLTEVLQQKNAFLQTKGDIDSGTFEFAWRDSVEPPNIIDINIRREKDIFIDLIDSNRNSFTGILRWGKGCGMTNIRFDIR